MTKAVKMWHRNVRDPVMPTKRGALDCRRWSFLSLTMRWGQKPLIDSWLGCKVDKVWENQMPWCAQLGKSIYTCFFPVLAMQSAAVRYCTKREVSYLETILLDISFGLFQGCIHRPDGGVALLHMSVDESLMCERNVVPRHRLPAAHLLQDT